jgi:hypothetical protein
MVKDPPFPTPFLPVISGVFPVVRLCRSVDPFIAPSYPAYPTSKAFVLV